MNRLKEKLVRRNRRCRGIRKCVIGTLDRPRLAVFRSNRHMYAQVIDDLAGKTLAAASSGESMLAESKGSNCQAAAEVGKRLAERARAAGIETVAFDRGGFLYHGRVKALADAAREGGLKF